MGISQQALSKWENEKTEPDNDSLVKLANYFNVSIMYPIIRLKLRGKKDYIVIDKYSDDSYDFTGFVQEECTSNDNGKVRLILDDIQDIEKLEKYILDQYESALEGNKTYIENVKIGQTNYNKFLRENYQ